MPTERAVGRALNRRTEHATNRARNRGRNHAMERDWEATARYLAAMLALVPAGMRQEPDEDDLSLADDILAQYPPVDEQDER